MLATMHSLFCAMNEVACNPTRHAQPCLQNRGIPKGQWTNHFLGQNTGHCEGPLLCSLHRTAGSQQWNGRLLSRAQDSSEYLPKSEESRVFSTARRAVTQSAKILSMCMGVDTGVDVPVTAVCAPRGVGRKALHRWPTEQRGQR